ncbi:MAG: peptide deformylase [Firmicutes bacterium]|nr:peptide deformylase [Bacillota bacterium]
MALRTIREEGDEILKKKSKDVEVIDDRIKELIQDMIETLHKHDGVGLAAVQVGVLKKVVIIDLGEEGKPPFVLINPYIIKQEGEQTVEEGCLSFPNKFAKIIRPKEVIVKYLSEDGKEIELDGEDLLAQALSHEMDHLNGIVFVDKIIPGTLEIVTEKDKNDKDKKRKTQ